MADLALGGTTITVKVPGPSRVTMAPPAGPRVLVVPVAGPQGSAGSSYTHTQAAPASVWTITHSLGKYPMPTILLDDDPSQPVWTDIEYTDANTLVLTFPSPVTGHAYL